MKLALKILTVAGATTVVGVVIYGLCRLIHSFRAGVRLLNECKDYECDDCPTQGLCGLSDDK